MTDPSREREIRPSEIRAAAIRSELDRAAAEYKDALNEFEGVRQRLEAAKERFASVRRLAPDVLPPREWSEWQYHHEDLWMVALDIGEAIQQTLHAHAVESAVNSLDSKGVVMWDPSMTSWQIVDALAEHGFEFRTATPRREVHAALLHLKGVKKSADNRFTPKDADEIYAAMRDGYAKEGLLSQGEPKMDDASR